MWRLSRRGVPARAVIGTTLAGIVCILSGKTADLITLSALGAVLVYALCGLSLIRLRRAEPRLERPFRVPLYPVMPLLTVVLSIVCLAAIAYSNMKIFSIFVALMGIACIGRWIAHTRAVSDAIRAS